MKYQLLLLIACISLISGRAQERKSLTMPLEGGTLTFQYYEKDGVKVPDGPMEFKKDNYTESGVNKDGYREGRWVAKMEYNTNSTVTEYDYSKGMLDGTTTVTFTTSDESLKKLHAPFESFNFKQGRLFGKNKIITLTDTIYCNLGEGGKRVGTWKKVNDKRTLVIEYNDDSTIKCTYELDILGQKKPIHESIEANFFMDLYSFGDRFKQVFFNFRDKKRPELPTLCDNKYGYLDAWVNMDEE